jgi:ribonuclease BN (tRNA processing enzyme)
LIDAGQGVPQQLLRAGIEPAEITDILITHHHSDHNVSLGAVLMAAWAHGRSEPISIRGPQPLARIVHHYLEANRYDIELRMADEGRIDLRELVHADELNGSEQDIMLGPLRLTATLVDHPPVYPALGYRLDAEDGSSVVVSGDTAPSKNLIELADGADVLIHEVINLDLIAGTRAASTNADDGMLRDHLTRSHTDIHDIGRVASAACVKTLVLSHKVPADRFDDSGWREPIESAFEGSLILGQDLMSISTDQPAISTNPY